MASPPPAKKRNPDVFELARGKSGRMLGDLVALLTTLKGIPAGYQKDLQEDKALLFDALVMLNLPASLVLLVALTPPPEIKEIGKEVERVVREKDMYLEAQEFEKAASLREKEKILRGREEEMKRDWDKRKGKGPQTVSEEDIEGNFDLARGWAKTTPVIVTIAERGAIVLRGGREVEVGGFPADEVVDQTGAGDAFCAGLALALAEGDDLEAAARFANAVASFAVEGVGTIALAPREKVQARMQRHSSSSVSSPDRTPPGRTIP